MTSTWEAVKARTRRLSDSILHRNSNKDIRDIQFGEITSPITMNLDGTELVYENQMWRLGTL